MLPLRNEGKHKNQFHLLSPVVLKSRKIIYRTMAEKKTLKVSRLWELLWVAMIPQKVTYYGCSTGEETKFCQAAHIIYSNIYQEPVLPVLP